MRTFKDSTGESWQIAVTGALVKQVLAEMEVDLGRPTEGSPTPVVRFGTEVVFLVDLLYITCRQQAEARQLTDIQFAERLQGKELGAAKKAFEAEWADFSQSLGRVDLARAIEAECKRIATGVQTVAAQFDSQEYRDRVDSDLQTLGNSCANLLRSPEQIPKGEPSAS